jgi:hypothetical protein
MKLRIVVFAFFLMFSIAHGFSQLMIPRTFNPPVIDGNLDDECWETAAVITDFLQREPNEGQPMTDRTEVFICYDDDNIYFGIKCYQDPRSIAAKEMLRDAALGRDDRVHILLDTYRDGRNAYMFGVNPIGSIEDGIISENGRHFNRSWDGLFEGRSKITDYGWAAELAIPFKTLSFDKNISSWGLFMNRFIINKQEYGSWPVGNLNSAEFAVSDGGIISGLEGLTQGIGLDIAPYFLSGSDGQRDIKTSYRVNGGGDIFYQMTPSLKASLSINTDFAETEADPRQINLTRFNIRLNEKRNFFLDGANFFNFGFEGRWTEAPSGKLNPFFSRRIGLDAAGSTIPVNYGAKLTGRINDWNVGLLHVSENRDYGKSYSSIARVARNFGQQSSVGIINTFGNALSDAHNMVTGLDLNLSSSNFMGNKNVSLILYGIKSNTEDIRGNDVSWGGTLYYPNDLINFRAGHLQIGENFITGLGFVPRTNIKETWADISIGPRINRWGIRQLIFGGDIDYVTDFDNILQSMRLTVAPLGIRFQSGERFNYSINQRYEFLERDFNIYEGYIIPADEYRWWENRFSLTTVGSRDVYGTAVYTFGNFYTGQKNSSSLALNWKVFVNLFLGGAFTREKVNLPDGEFAADIFQFNANILFSPRLTLYNYLQYDSQSETAGLQTRFRWILQPGNEILFVWNSGYSDPFERLIMSQNAIRLKLKYNFRF